MKAVVLRKVVKELEGRKLEGRRRKKITTKVHSGQLDL